MRKANRTENILGPLLREECTISQNNDDGSSLVCDLCNATYSLYSCKMNGHIQVPHDIQKLAKIELSQWSIEQIYNLIMIYMGDSKPDYCLKQNIQSDRYFGYIPIIKTPVVFNVQRNPLMKISHSIDHIKLNMELPKLKLPLKFNKHTLINMSNEEPSSPTMMGVYHSELASKKRLLQQLHSMIIKNHENAK